MQHPTFGERSNNHHFQFVLVSSQVSDRVKEENYQRDEPAGFIGKPALGHYTELWAVPWSHFLDDRRGELDFLQSQVDLTADPDALEYLRRRVPDLIPPDATDATPH